MLTFFPREWNVFRSNLSLPGGQGVCILYARVVFALSTTKKKVIFVVIRTFLLLEIDVFITRGVCFSSDDEDAEKKRNNAFYALF